MDFLPSWSPRQKFVSHHLYLPYEKPQHHPSPESKCTCGVYAHKNSVNVTSTKEKDGTPIVFGEVSLWGRVFVHSDGYRAEFAYPRRLMIVEDVEDNYQRLADELSSTYSVPVEIWKK